MTITPPGAYPGDRPPLYPLTPLITLAYNERGDHHIEVEAWAVGTDGSRCTRTWWTERATPRAYPEFWDAKLRQLAAEVQWEMEQAGIWQPTVGDVTPERPPAP